MRRAQIAGVVLLTAVLGFLVGVAVRPAGPPAAVSKRGTILYYHDPMHPSYRSDKPGTAPDCGMRLEPVYAGGHTDPAAPQNAVRITEAQRQLIGLKTARVDTGGGTSLLRTTGRVAADERRVYRINATIDGWIREIFPNTTGSFVHKDEYLASFYAPEMISPQQGYLYALNGMDRFQPTGKETAEQIKLAQLSIQSSADTLRNLGMSEPQLDDIAKTRKMAERIYVASPADGFVLARNLTPGLRFERGTELYRIADLSRVWVVADVFEREAASIRRGQKARMTSPTLDAAIDATVSDILPQLDPVTRTLKVRMEVANPGLKLRPDMFVDVEFATPPMPGISVPIEAVIDAGRRKVVFIDQGDGYYEPRRVETGWRTADRVQIAKGLKGDEKVVTSGSFLVDSESRLKLGDDVATDDAAVLDPVCGMTVDPEDAKRAGLTLKVKDKDYYFCSAGCRDKFAASPKKTSVTEVGWRHD